MEHFERITIIGMGLIGGSMALALKKARYRGEITGCDLSSEALKEAKTMRAIDIAETDIKKAVSRAQLVIISIPAGNYEEIFRQISGCLQNDAIVTDTGSIKGYVMEIAEKYLPDKVQFIGGHPMAGSEKGGIKAATPFLYENAYYFLTPAKNILPETIKKMEAFVKFIGAYAVLIDSYEHDKAVAQISHIPHLSAVILVNMLDTDRGISYIPFAGGGFRDTTRIASGNPHMWKDIFCLNKKEVMRCIDKLQNLLEEFKEALNEPDKSDILEILQKAKLIRDSIPHYVKDYLPQLHEIIIDVEDRPGVLGELTRLIGENNINIKEIEILHVREGERGAVRIGFEALEEREKALYILKDGKFLFTYRKGE